LRKYKKEDWKWEIIDTAETVEELSNKEKFWVEKLDALNREIAYNSKEGGMFAKLTDEIKAKMSESRKGEKNHFYGKTHTQEVKDKFSKLYKGKKLPTEQVERSAQNHKKQILDLTTNEKRNKKLVFLKTQSGNIVRICLKL
jgi:glutamyl/glutaminyl-tRNA synthetase